MKFTLSSTALSSKLVALSKVINSKNSLPILSDFVFEVENNTLHLTASDSENMMKTSVELTESDSNGKFAIGNHDLLEAVRGFSEQPITFEVNQQENIAKISYQNGHFSLPVENADEFPQAQEISGNATTIIIASNVLSDNINHSIFATAQDELRPAMKATCSQQDIQHQQRNSRLFHSSQKAGHSSQKPSVEGWWRCDHQV